MTDEPEMVELEMPVMFGVGYLGATCDSRFGQASFQAARDAMIERRILRIEMALRRAGTEVEHIPLPELPA